ncbi:putative ABC transporter substrate-binding protein [Rhodococcus rhodochrous]|uniref:ABC transporter substrate-binding protein n=1 Tax=Rhodococcus rhodochrous TaxID=1829 RepID=UPI000750C31D|nr:ABC transporter substrate-binding protein [Rhodococcus rhodochrous]MDO1484625.1 ABC transporter substrate-binding protein [Rhodococcus rhodochrous]SNV27241.1 putative ABC transporter substrate-binding protein [Rhodococcus rhodochrous]
MSLAVLSAPRVRRVAAVTAAAALTLLAGACGSSEGASADQATDISVGSSPGLSGVGLRAGISEGIFSDLGLNVTAAANKSANDAVPQLLSGTLQIAQMDTVTLMQARVQGLPVRVVAGAGVQATDGEDGVPSAASVVTAASSAIQSPTDLVDRKVGVPAIKTQTWMNIRAVVDKAGGDSSRIDFVEVPPAQTIDLVQQGYVDAATPNEPLASSAIASGTVRLVHNTDAPGNQGVPSSVYVASEEFIAKNPDTVRKFVEGIHQAAEIVNADKEIAKKVAIEELGFSEEQLANAFIQPFATTPVTAEQLDKIANLAVEYEILTEKPSFDEILVGSE